jgi:hypothetical protein
MFEAVKANEALLNVAKTLRHAAQTRIDKMKVDNELYQNQMEELESLVKRIRRREVTFVPKKDQPEKSADTPKPFPDEPDTLPDQLP